MLEGNGKKVIKRLVCLALAVVMLAAACPWSAKAYNMGKEGVYQTISAGGCYTAAIKSDGTLWTWGSSFDGQLGNGTDGESDNQGNDSHSSIPVKVLDDVVTVSCGIGCDNLGGITSHTAAIKSDGTLWTWGYNYSGQLGNGTTDNSSVPVKVMDNVVAVSAGGYHTAAIKSDGTLWTWGLNDGGQLGNGTTDNSNVPIKVMDNVVAVSTGRGHTAAIKSDGTLWTWGYNGEGQLGNGTGGRDENDNAEYSVNPVKVMDDVVAVSAGSWHTAAIKSDGTLWTWGYNVEGELGNGAGGYDENYNAKYSVDPVKVLDDVVSVSAGSWRTAAIKSDGTLWTWGACYLGNGTEDNSSVPVKVMDDVVEVSTGYNHRVAVKSDGTLWTWGSNTYGQLGNGTGTDSSTLIQVLTDIKLPDTATTTPTVTTPEYIYDTEDPGASVVLDTDALKAVTDTDTAVEAVEALTGTMTDEQKQSATGIDLATLYAEEAIANVASKMVTGSEILIDKANITDLEAIATQTSSAVETALVNGGVTTARIISNTVTLTTDETGEITILVDPDVLETSVDKVQVSTPTYMLTFKFSDLEEDFETTGRLTFKAQSLGTGMAVYDSIDTVDTVKVTTSSPVTVSLPAGKDDTTYKTIAKDDGTAISSKLNPANNTIGGKVKEDGNYTIKKNEKDFTDISNKSAEMQNAIRYLASKGIIEGRTETTFAPDDSISRAEIATLLVRALGKLDNSAVCTFSDVTTNNWYYHAAASSAKAGYINGYAEDNTFRGNTTISKVQIVAVAARVLEEEMGYKTPSNTATYLGKYSDTVNNWAQSEVALATRENLVVYRTDGTFSGSKNMTRGDAAIILYRLFQKIW